MSTLFQALFCGQFISTSKYQFWLIYINIQQNGINFLRAPVVFTVSSFTFHKNKLPWLNYQGWVAPNSPKLNQLDYQVSGQCWRLIKGSNQSQKRIPSLKSQCGLPYRRKPLATLWKTTVSDCRNVCQPMVDILNIIMWQFTQQMLTVYLDKFT